MTDHLRQLTTQVLADGYLLSLGVTGEQGPWVCDVIYTFDDDFNLYWMSMPHRGHSLAIGKDSRVAGAITTTLRPGDPDVGLQLSGRAEQIESIDFALVKKYFAKRNKPEPLPTDDVLGEHVWYKFTPDCIELIYEPEFGWNRQKVR